MTDEVLHQVQFPRPGSTVYRIALIDDPNMSNLGHRGAPVGPLKSWFSPYVTGKTTGLRQYGHIGAPGRADPRPRRRPIPRSPGRPVNDQVIDVSGADGALAFARTATTEGGRR